MLSAEQLESVKVNERARTPLGRRELPEDVAGWMRPDPDGAAATKAVVTSARSLRAAKTWRLRRDSNTQPPA